jgi:hypothetical protein
MNPVTTGTAPTTPAGTPNVAPTAPAAPTQEKAKPMTLDEISYEAAIKLPVTDQDRLMKVFSRHVEDLKESRDEMKQESKRLGILLAALEERVKRGIDANIYGSTFTVSDLYKQVTSAKPPGHAWTLKCSYVSFVRSGFVTESAWLANRNNCLEIGQRIVDACIEVAPETGLQHEAVSRAANELNTRSDQEAKNLRVILASVKPVAPMTAEQAKENLAPILDVITADLALIMFDTICLSGNLPVCLAVVPDRVKDLNDTMKREAYIALCHSIQKTDAALGEELVAQLSEEASNVVNIKVTAGAHEMDPENSAPESTESVETHIQELIAA